MPHDTPLEAREAAEKAEQASEDHSGFTAQVSITIAVLAVLAAAAGSFETVEAGKAITASSEAVLKQDQATDNWGLSNSKSVRKNLYLIAAEENPAHADTFNKAEAKNEQDEEKSREKAQEFEKERDALMAKSKVSEDRHHWLTAAATLIEIAIAICTVAIITRRKLYWIGSLLLGGGGLILLVVAYLPMAA